MTKECVLVTGGAGYIGSNIINLLSQKNCEIICLDNFSNSYIDTIKRLKHKNTNITIINCDLLNLKDLEMVFSKHKITSVIHLAGKKYIPESTGKPCDYKGCENRV